MEFPIKSFSLGLQGDVGAIFGGGAAVGIAWDGDDEHIALYTTGAFGAGIIIGASVGLECGAWVDKISPNGQNFTGIEVEAGYKVGGGLGLYFDPQNNMRFLGFGLVVGPAIEVDVRVAIGRTNIRLLN